eukprot:TRINITY_DN12102_c0_g1_i1.p1 TRINITY_DN12102_c0_g1~~TRINITY_DN12102_c0_g1_i1.p1  ORF type:complete len:748 (-),score=181.20 TRINITY_DN12102_c0_g1_i1:105-2348(-)
MSVRLTGHLKIKIQSAKNLANADVFGKSDPYVIVRLDKAEVAKTKTIDNDNDPVWNFEDIIDVNEEHETITFHVFDEDPGLTHDDLGFLTLPVAPLLQGKISGPGQLTKTPKDIKSILNFEVSLTPPTWELVHGNFPMRNSCSVSLYQSAHVEDGDIPELIDVGHYTPGKCWEDIYRSILHAKHFVYLTGWSLNIHTQLLRVNPIIKGDGTGQGNGMMNMGELLKFKASEGVRVLVHLWNEKASVTVGTSKTSGIMNTHDEETQAYFENTPVVVKLSYRHGTMTGHEWIFTHHQKSVILDEALKGQPLDSDTRRVVAYVGGLDLCDGRWDTPKKTLYRSLNSAHKGDWHMPWPGPTEVHGPREPWQDIHSRVEGPAARDVLTNFEQRWHKQGRSHVPKLLNISEIKQIIPAEDDVVTGDEVWNVQLFRSIDQYSVNKTGIEKDIQLGYVNAIRCAERFIYIENQYFLGSSQYWLKEKDTGAVNLIPIELTKKVISKIESGQDFAIYVVIPLYPEGVPVDGAVQEILHWQANTFRMMYSMIAAAIAKKGLNKHPCDYLNVYCLGNRETSVGCHGGPVTKEDIEKDTDGYLSKLTKSRRFQVYVHSKMMIVDDKYIIVGSANINERSMGGNRDTEIAIGAYQPKYDEDALPKGEVHKFRMALWAEHFGCSLPQHLAPEKPENIQKMNDLALHNWALFEQADVCEMEGHIMKYPYQISQKGEVVAKPERFPDTEALVEGVGTSLPDTLTI